MTMKTDFTYFIDKLIQRRIDLKTNWNKAFHDLSFENDTFLRVTLRNRYSAVMTKQSENAFGMHRSIGVNNLIKDTLLVGSVLRVTIHMMLSL